MKKVLIYLCLLIISASQLYSQNVDNYYYADGNRIYWTEDSTSVNIIIKNLYNYDTIVKKLELLFQEESGQIIVSNEDDNIIVNSNSLRSMHKDSIINAISIADDDILFFSYSKLINNERIWLRNEIYVKTKLRNVPLSSLFPIINTYNNVNITDEGVDYRIDCKTENDLISLANILHDTSKVIYSTPDFYCDHALCTNDTYFNEQWGLKNTG